MVLIDYCKAFGMVDHGLLLDKLKVYGVAGETKKWFQSYLADRHQLASLGSCMSDMALMKPGVLQGSILGPLFFTVFINDLPLRVGSSKNNLYADDTTITSSADCGSMGRLQESLLDLEIDEELSFSEHITTVSKKVTQRIGLFKKIMNYLPLNKDYFITML